jgi:hypothetical protein
MLKKVIKKLFLLLQMFKSVRGSEKAAEETCERLKKEV